MKTLVASLIAVLISVSPALAADLIGYTFLKISGPDGRAVVKTPEGEKQLVAAGAALGAAKIVEITADRVVLEQADEHGAAVLIVKIKDGRQQVSRIQQMPVKAQAVSVEPEAASRQFGR